MNITLEWMTFNPFFLRKVGANCPAIFLVIF